MPSDDAPQTKEREQTDESLRLEREKADVTLDERLALLDETADTIINTARDRADAVLAKARANTDRSAASSPTEPAAVVQRERARDDRALREERAEEDATLRAERAEQTAVLSAERSDTDAKLLSERARSDHALETRDVFLGIVAHDLRNMLGATAGFAALIANEASGAGDAARITAHAHRIQRSGARMARLVGDLVDVASFGAGHLALACDVTDPAQVVAEAIDTFEAQARAAGVSLVAEVGDDATTSFDPARILQVLANLISNAIKFTPSGGSVVVRVGRVGDDARFEVRDTGCGIPKEELDNVFERFLQLDASDRRGVGLGLYIAKCIMIAHGGDIWAESTVGEGCTFQFTLPMRSTTTGPEQDRPRADE